MSITATIMNIYREMTRIIFFVGFSDWTDKNFIINSELKTKEEIESEAMTMIKEHLTELNNANEKTSGLSNLLNQEITI